MSARHAPPGTAERGVAPDRFRAVMGSFATGVAVITSTVDGEPAGMTVNSLTSVSLDPPQLLVCLKRGTRTADAVAARGWFAAHVVGRDGEQLSTRFARPGGERFGRLRARVDEFGLPVLSGAVARMVCRAEATHDGATHDIVVGRVVHADSDPHAWPLVFFRGRFDTLTGGGHRADIDWYG
jgi:3-hydroxy-9,10-secoandrosta-1,3,5(10)-triene-9,17-dione monooxygenase reductase component